MAEISTPVTPAVSFRAARELKINRSLFRSKEIEKKDPRSAAPCRRVDRSFRKSCGTAVAEQTVPLAEIRIKLLRAKRGRDRVHARARAGWDVEDVAESSDSVAAVL